MKLSDLADAVKHSVTAMDVARSIGLEPNRAGFCKCPLHGEKTGSMKLYPGSRGWYCFGCGHGGSVIDLVMEYYGMDLAGAITFLNEEFSLGLPIGYKATKEQEAEAKRRAEHREAEQKRREAAEKARESAFERWLDLGDIYWQMAYDRADYAPKTANEEWDPRFVEALRRMSDVREEAEECAMVFNRKEENT